MLKAKNKKLSLLIAIVFAFTVLVPAGAVFADDADISGNYKYVSTGEQDAGSISINEFAYEDNLDTIVIRVSLPDGVEFTDDPEKGWPTVSGISYDRELIESSSDYYEIEIQEDGSWTENDLESASAVFEFIDNDDFLDIEDDFSGNLDVDVEVLGLGSDSHLWSETDSVTIAKVSGEDATVTADDPEKVSAGNGKEAAEITIEEPIEGTVDDAVYLEVETSGVEFNEVGVSTSRIVLDDISGASGNDVVAEDDMLDNVNDEEAWFDISIPSSGLPGKIDLTPYLDIDPDVTGDIEITVYSDDDDFDDTTLTVATIGDASAEITELDDNDTVVYAGQDEELDVSFDVEAVGGDFDEGDVITFELNEGELTDKPTVNNQTVKRYSDDEKFYVEIDKEEDFTVEDIKVAVDNDAEPGDLTLNVGGDYGDLGEITIGEIAQPYTVTTDAPEISDKAVDQAGGDLVITETDDDAFKKGEYIFVELPSGVELSEEPEIDVEEGSADAEIEYYDSEEGFVIDITEESTSKPSVFRVSDINYDTRMALTGDVELQFGGDKEHDAEEYDASEFEFEDDSVMHTVANATITDSTKVTASFTMGEEGVTIQNGRMLVQVNQLCDTLGLQKSWDAENNIAYFVKAGTTVQFPIGENVIVVNGNEIPVDQGGIIEDSYTYATLRGIQMAFGGELDWDNATKTATFEFEK